MLLIFDIGNTNITIGCYNEKELKFTARVATNSALTSDQHALEIRDVLDINGLDYHDVTAAAICSVVPDVEALVVKALKKLCKITPFVLKPGVKTGLNIKIDNPAQLGSDLAAGAVGAIAKYPVPCIVIDMGTATTISVVNSKKEFLGGAITAGLKLSLSSLFGNTAQLPMISISAPDKVIGTNTADCMRSGLVIGAAAMLDGMIDRINEQLGCECSVVATGGLSHEVCANCRHEIPVDDNLLLDGMRIIYEKNIK